MHGNTLRRQSDAVENGSLRLFLRTQIGFDHYHDKLKADPSVKGEEHLEFMYALLADQDILKSPDSNKLMQEILLNEQRFACFKNQIQRDYYAFRFAIFQNEPTKEVLSRIFYNRLGKLVAGQIAILLAENKEIPKHLLKFFWLVSQNPANRTALQQELGVQNYQGQVIRSNAFNFGLSFKSKNEQGNPSYKPVAPLSSPLNASKVRYQQPHTPAKTPRMASFSPANTNVPVASAPSVWYRRPEIITAAVVTVAVALAIAAATTAIILTGGAAALPVVGAAFVAIGNGTLTLATIGAAVGYAATALSAAVGLGIASGAAVRGVQRQMNCVSVASQAPFFNEAEADTPPQLDNISLASLRKK